MIRRTLPLLIYGAHGDNSIWRSRGLHSSQRKMYTRTNKTDTNVAVKMLKSPECFEIFLAMKYRFF